MRWLLINIESMRTLSTKEWIAVAISVGLVIYFFVFSGTGLFSFNNSSLTDAGAAPLVTTATTTIATTTMDTTPTPIIYTLPGIIVTDAIVGSGEEAVAGKNVTVHYTGAFANGQVFDSSIPRGQPFVFNLGGGQVIRGWDEGVVGMKVGGKRTLVISPDKAYGAQGVKNPYTGEVVIPPNATLTFEVELLGVN
jgi:FKBP-type peptidyl-prolyl cis-trans isomerase